jgi:hypothetical protein
MYARRLVIANTDSDAASTMKTKPSLSSKSKAVALSCRFAMMVVQEEK